MSKKNYIVYLHAFTEDSNGDFHPVENESDIIAGYSVYVVDDSNVDDMPVDEEFPTLELAQAFADEMAEKYDTHVETY